MNAKQDMAEDRTDWAEDRTILANERTFAGWLRTGMACIAIALAFRAIFGEGDPVYAPARITATLFCAAAILIFWMAWRKCCATLRRMSDHAVRPLPRGNITVITVVLSFGAAATGVLLWLI